MNKSRRYCVKSEISFESGESVVFLKNNVSLNIVLSDYETFDYKNCTFMIDKDKNVIVIYTKSGISYKRYFLKEYKNVILINFIDDELDITKIEFHDEYISVKKWKQI